MADILQEALSLVEQHRNLSSTLTIQALHKSKQPFVVFCHELLNKYGVSLAEIREKIAKTKPLVEFIQLVDRLIDEDLPQINRLQYGARLVGLPWVNRYNDEEYKCITLWIKMISELFAREAESIHGYFPYSQDSLQWFLDMRNSDFKLYLDICKIHQYSSSSRAFFNAYVEADLILDDFCDLLHDLKYGAFNLISWKAQTEMKRKLPVEDLKECLIWIRKTESCEELFLRADQSIERALNISKEIPPLRWLAEGEDASLRALRMLDFLCDPELALSETGLRIRSIITKPHPWERVYEGCQ